MQILHGNCLNELKKLPDNSIDSCVCDPPYFLTNDSGSGFMGKEWDSLSVANAFAEALLKSLNPVLIMGEGSFVRANVSTKTKYQKMDLSLIALYATPKFIGQNQELSPITFSVLQSVLTRPEVLALSKGLCPNLTTAFENQPDNVLYVLDHSFIQSCPNSIAHELALKLATNKICEDLKTLHSLTVDQKTESAIEEMTGKPFEKKSIEEMDILVKNVESVVAEERYNVTMSSPIEYRKIIQWIISSRSVRNAMATFMEIPGNIQILSERFHYNWAKEVLRVLKPGGHLLAFAGTRTYHPLARAIESVGFEIRDCIQWLYGSGFPKSTNVALRIDKESGAIGNRGKGFNAAGQGISLNQNKELRSDHPDYVAPEYKTDSAKQWQGWGTALKPANEPICVARKPLEKGLTVAQNVQKYGTGAINIDASRIAVSAEDQAVLDAAVKRMTGDKAVGWKNTSTQGIVPNSAQGRWPANVIFDEEAAAMLDESTGLKDPVSRFFYVAKASKSERNAGLEGMPLVKSGVIGTGEGGGPMLTGSGNERTNLNQNFHPTVKPIKLMEYLIRLVTPPSGTVLDPFMGSGSTGVAAKKLGFNFIGCELNEEYVQIAEKRMSLNLEVI